MENLALFEMYGMQHTPLRATIIFFKIEIVCMSKKYNSLHENSLKHVC